MSDPIRPSAIAVTLAPWLYGIGLGTAISSGVWWTIGLVGVVSIFGAITAVRQAGETIAMFRDHGWREGYWEGIVRGKYVMRHMEDPD